MQFRLRKPTHDIYHLLTLISVHIISLHFFIMHPINFILIFVPILRLFFCIGFSAILIEPNVIYMVTIRCFFVYFSLRIYFL